MSPETLDAGPADPVRILLVEDDVGVRNSVREVLEGEGYGVVPAGDGREALGLAEGEGIGLVLLDLNLPGMNGWDIFERLTAVHPLLPVIIVTARPHQLYAALCAGAGALMEKPLDIPMLLGTIRQLLAEPAEVRLARLVGQDVDFRYAAARRDDPPPGKRREAGGLPWGSP